MLISIGEVYSSKFVMRDIQVILKYPVSEKRLVKITVNEESDAGVLFAEVAKHFGVDVDAQILKFKRDRYTIKIVAGWPLSFYELKNQLVIDVESTEDNLDLALEETANSMAEKKREFLRKTTHGRTAMGMLVKAPLETISENAEYTRPDIMTLTSNRVTAIKNTNEENFKGLVSKIKKGEDEFDKLLKKGELEEEFLDISDSQGWYPIHYAINYRNKLAVKHFVEAGASLDVSTKEGFTPLMLCLMKKEYDMFKLLIDSGKANINKSTSKGTVLHYAIESKNEQFVSYLISKSADPFLENAQHQKAIDLIDDKELREKLLKSKEEEKTLHDLKAKPPGLRGTVYKTGNFFRNLKQRYIVVNTTQRSLIRYKCKADVPNKPVEIIPLKDIVSVTTVSNKLFLQHGFYYFQINYGSNNVLASKSKQMTTEWVERLKRCIDYSKRYDKQMRSSPTRGSVMEADSNDDQEIDMDNEKLLVPKGQSSTILVPVSKPRVTINLASFEILKFLGRGSFGRVYKVRLKLNNKIYAMKVLNKELLMMKKQIKYAQAEANILKNSDHPFMLSMSFSFQTPTNLYMVIDYCSGGDLSIVITQQNYFTEDQTRFYVAELVLAIENLHQMKVFYRDLKPENILLDHEGHIKLADFGLCIENVGKNDIAKSFCGSHIYLAPEMVSRKGFTQESDFYGIGLCLYEMLYGQLPFYNEDIEKLHSQIKKDEVKFPSEIRVSSEAIDLMASLLKKNPKERLGSKGRDEVRNHPFFRGINWDDVLNRKLEPPLLDEDLGDIDLKRKIKINDRDYTEANKTVMRIKDFTFVRDSELEFRE